eukprot:COSAG02_NODE_1260_length_13563_cov_28.883764_6_plen_57_part_00
MCARGYALMAVLYCINMSYNPCLTRVCNDLQSNSTVSLLPSTYLLSKTSEMYHNTP